MATANDNNRLKLVAACLGMAVALVFAAWQLGVFQRDNQLSEDPQVADLERAIQGPGEKDLQLLNQKYEQLTPQQQREFAVRKMLMSLPMQEQKLRAFFAQTEAEQWQQINREIDAMEAKSQQAEPVNASQGAGRGKVGAVAGPQNEGKAGRRADPRHIMAMKQEWTANASPELRSMMDRRVQMINRRRKERGLSPL